MHIGFLYNFFTIPKCSYNCLLEYICDFQKNNFFTIPNVSTLLYKYENKAFYEQILYLFFFSLFFAYRLFTRFHLLLNASIKLIEDINWKW